MAPWWSLLWFAVAVLLAGCPRDATPPNLLLITLDTTRPDALGAYGNPGGHTPHLDRLAREGVVFEEAVAPMATTFPSHASVLTGLYPRRHQLRSNYGRLHGSFETLAERLRARGYQTAAWVSFESMLSRGHLNQGFDALSHPVTGKPAGFPKSGEEVNRLAVPWLRARQPGRPFFAWVHYFEPHSPYRLTPYAARELGGYSGPLAEGAPILVFYGLGGEQIPWTDAERRAIRILYDGEVREADRLVGELLSTLEDAGVGERTIVVVTSDHGQHLGEHDRVGHAFSLWEVGLRVPLLIRDPREPGARRVATRVGIVDLMPTLLELLGCEVPQDLDGRSLADAVRGRPLAEQIYFAEVEEETRPDLDRDTAAVALHHGSLKGVLRQGRFLTYDLERDPDELHPLAPHQLPDGTAELERLATGYHPHHEGAPTQPAPEVAEELRALGYLR